MDIRRLEAFQKVYELRSFSKAARDLFLSQPTISAHIASLESELGTQLFDRIGKTILPTRTGEKLYGYAREVFSLLDRARAEIDFLQNRVAGRLSIGASTIPADYILPGILAAFSREYPDVEIDLVVGDSAQIRASLLSGELDLGMVGALDDHPDINYFSVMKDELILIAPPQYKSAGLDTLNREGLQKLPWIFREKGSGTRQSIEDGLTKMGLEVKDLKVVATVHSTGAVLSCVRSGLGVSVTSRLAAGSLLERGELKSGLLAGLDLQRCFYVAYRKGRLLLPAAKTFISKLERQCQAGRYEEQCPH